MIYRRLFDLDLRHEWGPCLDLELVPRTWSPAGPRALARHRLRAHPRLGGLEIAAPITSQGEPLIALAGLTLHFDIDVRGDFNDYTDRSTWIFPGLPTYRNNPDHSLGLHPGPLVHPPATAAAIEIAEIHPAWLSAPPTFRLTFPALRPYWVYYLFTARAGDLAPRLLDGDLQRSLSFQRAALTPELLADDPLGVRLLAHHPGRRGHRFTSAQPIACRRAPLRQLGLHLGDEELVHDLPSPDLHNHATHKVEPEGAPRRSLFCVLEY